MRRLIVLGPSGMLGQALVTEATRQHFPCITAGTSGDVPFRFEGQNLSELADLLELGPDDTLVNCIGWIPQKATGIKAQDEHQAYLLNRDLIRALRDAQQSFGFQWVQILTDCVFSGRQGPYSEDSTQDAQDLYGLSKIAGEQFLQSAVGIRSSIVGPDKNSTAGLFAWLRHSIASKQMIDGYSNVHWNGVTTLAFSKLSLAIAKTGAFPKGVMHWIPADSVSKYELLKLFAAGLHAPESFEIRETVRTHPSDRRLATLSPTNNHSLWEIAGYSTVPTISQLVDEFISQLGEQN